MKKLIPFAIVFSILYGCSKGTNPVTSKPPAVDTSGYISFVIGVHGLHPLRLGEHYIFWWKTLRDTSWEKLYDADTLHFISSDSMTIVGKFKSNLLLDSFVAARVTIESPGGLSLPLVETYNNLLASDSNTLTTSFDAKNILGDYSALRGSIVFTSPLPDTLSYLHEFYLMNFADKTPALQLLPLPPNGWKYGLWVVDSAFTPHEYFFYGLFSTPLGHDSDSANDHYAFPGGWKPQQLNSGTGSIFVTLEPLFYGDSLKYIGPSSFTLLRFDRKLFITKNQNYPMTSIATDNIPYGTLVLRK